MAESRNRDLATSLGQAVKNNTITTDGSLSVVGLTAYDSAGLLPSSYDSNNAGTLGFAEDSDKLYIHTGQGWFNIAIINTTPIFTASPSASYELATDATAYKNGTATVITLAARDSEGFPVTFSATGNSAFNNIAHVDKDSAAGFIFTVEPKSQDSVGEAAPAAGTLTFSVTDGINTASATSTFSLLFDQSVANSEGTTFFLGATGNNLGNGLVGTTDESDSPHTLANATVPSEKGEHAQKISYSPFAPQGYSTLFGGASDTTINFLAEATHFIKYKNGTHFAFGAPSGNSNDFTVEGWYYSTKNSANTRNIFDFRGSSTSNLNIAIEINSADGRLIARAGSSAVGITGGTGSHASTDGVFKDFEWNHVAWVRNATTSKIYINGCECMSFTDNNNYVSAGTGGDNYFVLGRTCPGNTGATDDARYVGYVRDFRVVKGTAVYTANFAPPTAPLQTITNTEFLICNKPYIQGMGREAAAGKGSFMSSSTGPVSEGIAFVAFSPYKIQNQWSAAAHGGCLNDLGRIQASGHADFQFGTSTDFTIELWFLDRYAEGDQNVNISLLDTRTTSGNGWHIYMYSHSSGHIVKVEYGTTSSSTVLLSSTIHIDFILGTWNHIAFTRSGSTHKLFHNGEQITTSGTSVDWNSSGALLIGSQGSSAYPIYIGPMRIVKGTAVYSGNFYPPTAPFTKTGSTYKSLKDPGNDNSTTVNNSITASETVFLLNFAPNAGDRAGMAGFAFQGQMQDQDPRIYDGPVSNTGSQKYSVPSVLWDKTDYEYMEIGNNAIEHLQFPNVFSNEAFTFEGWIQWSGTAETQNGLDPNIVQFASAANITDASFAGLYADVSNSGKLQMTMGSTVSSTGSAVEFSNISGANLLDGNWHHIVLCRHKYNGRISLYVDGTRHNSQAIYTGRLAKNGYKALGGGTYITSGGFRYTGGWNGNMSQMRLKKGVTMYPQHIRKETLTPTTAFNSARTVGNGGGDTKLIACHASSLTDGSASNHTITSVGSAAVSNWAPNGGMKSVYFNGTSQYLTVPDSADWSMGSGAMTAEAWVWIESYQSSAIVIGQWGSPGLAWVLMFNSTTGYLRYQIYSGSAYTDVVANNTPVPLQTWTHVALIKTGSYSASFVNGDLVNQTNSTVHPQDGSSTLAIGARSDASQRFKGYISNVRVTKGSYLYNVDFTSPAEAMYG